MTDDYYPLQLRAVAKEMVWGGRNLERLLDKPFAPDVMIGETWEAWDGCVIENGKHRGATLGQLIEQDAAGILGTTVGKRLPLLFKFIDAQGDLSVQVHPTDEQAQRLENYRYGKTEAWYILHAEPGAQLIHGFKDEVDAKSVREHLHRHRLNDLLAYVPVQAGDVIFVPAGVVHAILKGIVLAEIQENSDITYRLYDWARDDPRRPLHITQSMQVTDFARQTDHKIPTLTIYSADFDRHFLAACRFFSFELLDVRAPIRLATNNRFQILSIIQGAAHIDKVAARRGQTWLVPAAIDWFSIEPFATSKILRAYLPDLRRDVILPLVHAGIQADAIARLGGALPRHNDLIGAI
jgi:mannose-6-phosphate isomerase